MYGQGHTMEKMLTMTQDQFAALLKRNLTMPAEIANAPTDEPWDRAAAAGIHDASSPPHQRREAYRYSTVRANVAMFGQWTVLDTLTHWAVLGRRLG